jgi:hypothetical protein
MPALLISAALGWLLVAVGLVLLWYILAPLFTPAALRGKRRPRVHKRKKDKAEVVEGKGRLIE